MAMAGSFRDTLLHFLPDDCFYYLEIARRIWLGQGSTFDGINQTNGYHPLWLILLLPIAPLMNFSREAGARVVMALGVVLLGAALFVLRSVAARLWSSVVPIAAEDRWVALLFPGSALMFAALYGLESPLTALIFTLLLWTITQNERPLAVTSAVVIGLLSGALVLSRLDSAVYLIAFDLMWALQLRQSRREETLGSWSAWLSSLVTQATLLSLYLAFNLLKFGHLLPISAIIKTERVNALNLLWARSLLALLAIAGLAAGLIVTWLRPRVRTSMVWYTAVVGSLLYLLLVAIGGGSESYSWYFTLPVICGGLFATALVVQLKMRGWRPWIVNGVALGFCLLLLTISAAGRLSTPQFASRFDRAKWIDAHAPAEAVFAEGNCGILGYFSRRSFIDLDGVSNSFDYERAIRDDRVAEWLTRSGLNAAVLLRTERLDSAPDGTVRRKLTVRGRAERQICLALTKWNPQIEDDNYILWRVVRIDGQCQ